jgi:hypothetical protein
MHHGLVGLMNGHDRWTLQAELLGYRDGLANMPRDVIITHSAFRRAYMRGFLRGRSKAATTHDVEFPEWINKRGEVSE